MRNIDARIAVVTRLYALWDQLAGSDGWACRRGCAHCCTRNVVMTSLEGRLLMPRLTESGCADLLMSLSDSASGPRFVPKTTVNGLADLFARGEPPPEEINEPAWGRCALLRDDACPVYPVRPFSCRCMVSACDCGVAGSGEMDEFTVTLATVFQQYLEHLDQTGYSGNMADIIRCLERAAADSGKESDPGPRIPEGLVANRPISLLMVPPAHQGRIRPVLDALNRLG